MTKLMNDRQRVFKCFDKHESDPPDKRNRKKPENKEIEKSSTAENLIGSTHIQSIKDKTQYPTNNVIQDKITSPNTNNKHTNPNKKTKTKKKLSEHNTEQLDLLFATERKPKKKVAKKSKITNTSKLKNSKKEHQNKSEQKIDNTSDPNTFSNADIDKLQSADRDYEYSVPNTKLLQIRVYPNGNKIFQIRYTNNGKKKRYIVGAYPKMNLEEARTKTQELIARIQHGECPAEDKQRKPSVSITIADLCDKYLSSYQSSIKASGTLNNERRAIDHIKFHLGNIPAVNLTRGDINDSKQKSGGFLSTLSIVLAYGRRKNYIRSNPASGIKRPEINSAARPLNQEDIIKLGQEIRKEKYNAQAVYILTMILLTGCYRDEVASLEFSFIDFEEKYLRLPNTKVGARDVMLNDEVMEIIKKLPRGKSQYLFPNTKDNGYYVNTNKTWIKIRGNIGLKNNPRITDLRHTYESVSKELQYNQNIIDALLGRKTNPASTIDKEELRDAANKISKTIANSLNTNL